MTTTATLAAAIALASLAASPSPSPSPSPDPKDILERAIRARGGEAALQRTTVLHWRGRAMLYAGERRTDLEGRWIVEPPDRAVIETREIGEGQGRSRRLVVLGPEGWIGRDGSRTPMPAEMLSSERERLELYAVLRLLPLRDPGVRLTATGPRSLRVERDGRPAIDLTFDGTGWLDRLRTQVRDPVSGGLVAQDVTFAGEVVAKGIRWPRRINVSRDGAPSFDLEILELGLGTRSELERESVRNGR